MENKSENRICQNCKKDFTIESEDFNFYEKIKVPPPTWCPECRLIRRLAFREDRPLYKDKCDKCGEEIISIYSREKKLVVYCPSCWWGDSWDATDYGREYDFSKSFFEQFNELVRVVPHQSTAQKNSVDCTYSNGNMRCKNLTLCFDGFESADCFNCQVPVFTRNSMDSDGTWNADHVYETLYSTGVYNTKFVYFSDECLDSSFLFNCIGCSDCFGCINLRNQKYCIFNKKYTKEEYKEEIEKFDLGSYKTIQEIKNKFFELYYKTPRRFASITNSTNVSGDDIKNAKNCKVCFSALNGVENCKYVHLGGLLLKDSHDVTYGGDMSELIYETNGCIKSRRSLFNRACHDSQEVEYSHKVYNCSYVFGCTEIRNKKYCILNKQYSEQEYKDILPKIKQQILNISYVDRKGRVYKYGEFFPSVFSPWAYNETVAQKYFPLTREEALSQGFNWYEQKDRDYEITIKARDLPDNTKDVPDSVLNEVIECEHNGIECKQECTTAFRILSNELQFLRAMQVALPRLCPSCRYGERIKMKNPPKLWRRKCMCHGVESEDKLYKNTIEHMHGKDTCPNEFETAISQDRTEIVYCEKCYQAEFV